MERRSFLGAFGAVAVAGLVKVSDGGLCREPHNFSHKNVTFDTSNPEDMVVRITGIPRGELHRRDLGNLWSYTSEVFDDFSMMGLRTPYLPIPRKTGAKVEGVDQYEIDLEIQKPWRIEVGL